MINQKIHQKTVNRMKVVLLFCIVFFFKNTIYCQSLESIKTADTIYIYFDHSEFQKIKGPDINSIKKSEEKRNYEIKFDSLNYVNFTEAKYLNFDRFEAKKESSVKVEKKDFLKKNKNIIIDIDFIKKQGLEKVFFNILCHKTIYLIDKKEITKKNVKLKEVGLHRYSYSFIE